MSNDGTSTKGAAAPAPPGDAPAEPGCPRTPWTGAGRSPVTASRTVVHRLSMTPTAKVTSPWFRPSGFPRGEPPPAPGRTAVQVRRRSVRGLAHLVRRQRRRPRRRPGDRARANHLPHPAHVQLGRPTAALANGTASLGAARCPKSPDAGARGLGGYSAPEDRTRHAGRHHPATATGAPRNGPVSGASTMACP